MSLQLLKQKKLIIFSLSRRIIRYNKHILKLVSREEQINKSKKTLIKYYGTQNQIFLEHKNINTLNRCFFILEKDDI